MPRKQKNISPPKKGTELRAEIKDYIRNERDTILTKWKCLEENVATMDKQAETFKARLDKQNTKCIPMNIPAGKMEECDPLDDFQPCYVGERKTEAPGVSKPNTDLYKKLFGFNPFFKSF